MAAKRRTRTGTEAEPLPGEHALAGIPVGGMRLPGCAWCGRVRLARPGAQASDGWPSPCPGRVRLGPQKERRRDAMWAAILGTAEGDTIVPTKEFYASFRLPSKECREILMAAVCLGALVPVYRTAADEATLKESGQAEWTPLLATLGRVFRRADGSVIVDGTKAQNILIAFRRIGGGGGGGGRKKWVVVCRDDVVRMFGSYGNEAEAAFDAGSCTGEGTCVGYAKDKGCPGATHFVRLLHADGTHDPAPEWCR